MNKNFKVTCGMLVYGFGSGIYFLNDEWYWFLIGLIITLSSMFYVLKITNEGEKENELNRNFKGR